MNTPPSPNEIATLDDVLAAVISLFSDSVPVDNEGGEDDPDAALVDTAV